MKFPTKSFRLIDIKCVPSKAGKELIFVKLADVQTFENCEFMLAKTCDVESLVLNTDYDTLLNVDGKFSTVHLYLPKPGVK